jgi:hypothetical protein
MKLINTLLAAAILFATATRAQDSLSAQARKVFADHQDSVIWISAVAKNFHAGRRREGGREHP